MSLRTAIITELFTRCQTARPDVGWIPGWPGDSPPMERVWVWEVEGDLDSPAFPDVYDDPFTITLAAESETPGRGRAEAMQAVESYLTVVQDIVRIDPGMGGQIDPGLATYLRTMRGPYSEPNIQGGSGFSATAAMEVEFQCRLPTPTTYPIPPAP